MKLSVLHAFVFGPHCIAGLMQVAAFSAHAAVLYDSGADPGTIGGIQLSEPANTAAVTSSFVLAASSTVGSVSFSNWFTKATAKPTTIDWAITSAAFSDVTFASGTSAISLGTVNVSGPFLPRAQVTFVVPALALVAGSTYWLQLSNEQFSTDDDGYWGWNNNPSGQTYILVQPGSVPIADHRASFQILGTAAVPEPAPAALLALGLGALGLGRAAAAFVRRRAGSHSTRLALRRSAAGRHVT